jgi:DNA-binding XRE family transcriptional regulator
MTPDAVDFTKVEALRKHMLLTAHDMAVVMGVSRVSYYNWLGGKPVRKANTDKVASAVRILLAVVRDHGWPAPEIVGLSRKMRTQRLLALVAQYQ